MFRRNCQARLTTSITLSVRTRSLLTLTTYQLDLTHVFALPVVQYEVSLKDRLECGGAYLKLLTATNEFDPEKLHDQSPYTIMFGPDKCGATNKVTKPSTRLTASLSKVDLLHLGDVTAVLLESGYCFLRGSCLLCERYRKFEKLFTGCEVTVHSATIFTTIYESHSSSVCF